MSARHFDTVGDYLRESRISLNLSTETVARALHIRTRYIEAIEAGKLEELPGNAYIRGYIRNYAEYLGLDSAEAISAYQTLPAATDGFFVPEPNHAQHVPSRPMLLASLIGLAALYGYWYGTQYHPLPLPAQVPQVPRSLIQSLDKNRNAVMDSAWTACLDSDEPSCFIPVYLSRTTAPGSVNYDDILFPSPTADQP